MQVDQPRMSVTRSATPLTRRRVLAALAMRPEEIRRNLRVQNHLRIIHCCDRHDRKPAGKMLAHSLTRQRQWLRSDMCRRWRKVDDAPDAVARREALPLKSRPSESFRSLPTMDSSLGHCFG